MTSSFIGEELVELLSSLLAVARFARDLGGELDDCLDAYGCGDLVHHVAQAACRAVILGTELADAG
jgi:hypothetical protein